jgi:hypothetical protein
VSPAAQLATLVPGAAYAPASQQPTYAPPRPAPAPIARPAPAAPSPPALPMAIPDAQPPPYFSSQTATRVGRPIEPWRDTLRLLMFVWGVGLLAVFATPLTTAPLTFRWDEVLHGDGLARLPPLMFAAVGLLGMIVAAIPMPPAARGFLAAILGLAGIAVPIALVGVPTWQQLTPMIGALILITGLILRAAYRDSLFARLLVTLGAIGMLVLYLLPQGGAIPLVSLFKTLIDQPGTAKILPALQLAQISIVVMSLLAWLPAPITGGAMQWAWLLILWPLIEHATRLALAGDPSEAIAARPNELLLPWIAGGVAMGSAYLVLVGYGLASVLGKQLE